MKRLLSSMFCIALVSCGSEPPPHVPGPPTPPLANLPAPSTSAVPSASAPVMAAGKTMKKEVTDVYHGESIVDPYRWLEESDSPLVKEWTAAQNAATRTYLDGPLRDKMRARLDELLQIGFVASPVVRTTKKGIKRYFHVRREGTQDQPIVYVREGIDGKDRVLLDPTKFGSDKTSALDWWYLNDEGTLVVYGASVSGNEQSTLYVRDVATGMDLADEIPRTRMSTVAFFEGGFYYSREPEPGTVPKDEEHYHRRLYEHVLGRHWKNDPLIFGEGRAMTDVPQAQVSPSGRWLVVRVFQGWAKSSVYVLDRKAKGSPKFTTVIEGPEALFDPLVHTTPKGDVILMRTNHEAPNFKLFTVDPNKPERANWKELVPEGPDPIRDFEAVSDTLFLSYLHRASSRLERRTLDGKLVEEITLPGLGTASVPHGEYKGSEALFEYESYATPPVIHRIDLKKKKGEKPALFAKIDAGSLGDTSKFVVDQIEAASKDGTKITAFVVHQKNLPKDGTAPGILYGYGGFNISQTPKFNRTVYAFLERGGVYVVANLRGGAEYGEAWHRAGMLDKKQNVFDDQIAVAEKLIADKWVAKDRLGTTGGSNGGLLVGALVTQRPDLFRAAISAVPLLDMLRYHRFLIAKLWIAEYGSSEDPKQYPWLRAYSPYHHVKDGTAYPAILLMTAESDSRVDPMHARKMAARLQEATSSGRPVLLRVETKAGHGAGKPRSKQLEELSDQYTFMFRELGVSF